MRFKQNGTKTIKTTTFIEPKFKVGDVIYRKTEAGTIFISPISTIKVGEGYIMYYITIERGMVHGVKEKEIKLYK